MQCTHDNTDTGSDTYRFHLSATTKATANTAMDALLPKLTEIVTDWGKDQPGLQFEVDITQLHKAPSLGKVKALAGTLRALRPHLIRALQHTTIHVHTRTQKALLRLVFMLQPPATPIRVVRSHDASRVTPCPFNAESLEDALEMEAEARRHPAGWSSAELAALELHGAHKTLARC